MGDGIFVSYRRDDSGWVAGRIYERMAAAFGEDRVFFDVLSIDVGLDYMEVIERWIAETEVFLLVMGPQWSTIEDGRGRRRIEVEDDPHVFEVATALEAGKRIIPVLVDGAHMPDRSELPEPIQALVRRNAYPLSQTSFHVGIQDLVSRIERVLPPPPAPDPPPSVGDPVVESTGSGDVSDALDPVPPPGGDDVAHDEEAPDDPPFLAPALGAERYEGFRWGEGLISPYFVTHPDAGLTVLEDALVLLVAAEVEEVAPLLPLLEEVVPTGRPLLVVAPDVAGEALATLVVNHVRGVFASAAVKAPGFGAARRALLHDLAVLTGAMVVGEDAALPLGAAGFRHVGSAGRVVAAAGETLLVEGGGRPDEMAGRVVDIVHAADSTESDHDRQRYRERALALVGELALAHRRAGELDAAMGALVDQEALCRRLGDRAALAELLTRQALVLTDRGDRRRSADCLAEAADIATRVTDPRLAAWIAGVTADIGPASA